MPLDLFTTRSSVEAITTTCQPTRRTLVASELADRRSRSSWKFRTQAEACSTVSSRPRYFRTSGSAFIAAHGATTATLSDRLFLPSHSKIRMKKAPGSIPGTQRIALTCCRRPQPANQHRRLRQCSHAQYHRRSRPQARDNSRLTGISGGRLKRQPPDGANSARRAPGGVAEPGGVHAGQGQPARGRAGSQPPGGGVPGAAPPRGDRAQPGRLQPPKLHARPASHHMPRCARKHTRCD